MLCYQIAEVILIRKILYLRKIRKGDIVLDIGANRGYTILFSLIVGKKGHVHAFKPCLKLLID